MKNQLISAAEHDCVRKRRVGAIVSHDRARPYITRDNRDFCARHAVCNRANYAARVDSIKTNSFGVINAWAKGCNAGESASVADCTIFAASYLRPSGPVSGDL